MTIAQNFGRALAASALVFSVTAQAATRSSAAMPATTSAQNVELVRSASITRDDSALVGGIGILLAIGGAVAAVAAIAVVAPSNDSPG